MKKELNEDMAPNASDVEMPTEEQDSANAKNKQDIQAKNKTQEFVMSNNQLPS